MGKRIKIEGKKIGKLQVVEYVGSGKYSCKCDCGNACIVFGKNLKSNHTTSCGCVKPISDLRGKTFGFLEVLERSEGEKRGKVKRTKWKCKCQRCGNIVSVYTDSLTSGFTKSCGCLQKEKDIPPKLRKNFVDGTQIDKIKSVPTAANKSGVVGVNWDKSRGRWQASIRFKGHKYNLGRFEDFDLACDARKKAEKKFFGGIIDKDQ